MNHRQFVAGLAISSALLTGTVMANGQQQYQPMPTYNQQQNMMGNQGMLMGGNQGMMGQNQGMMGQNQQMGTMNNSQFMVDPQMNLNNTEPTFIAPNPMNNMQTMQQDPRATMDAPGITNPFSINSLVNNANAQVGREELDILKQGVQSYVDGNLADARQIFTSCTERFPGGVASDRAMLGIAKIERAYGAYDVSRRILENVVRQNRDYESIMLARRSYTDLMREVEHSAQSAQVAMDMAYAEYKQIGWLNIFSKIKAYNSYKESKANFEALLVSTKQFDPIFAMQNISTPIPTANQPGMETNGSNGENQQNNQVPAEIEDKINGALTMDQLKAEFSNSIMNQPRGLTSKDYVPVQNIPEPTVTTVIEKPVEEPEANVEIVPAPAPVQEPTPAPAPAISLDAAKKAYLDAYEKVKQALKGNDMEARKQAQKEYQEALKQYNALRNK
jgi:hypothetical protein